MQFAFLPNVDIKMFMDFVIRCETEPSASDCPGNMVMLTMRSDGETISWDYTWPENLV